MDRLTRASGTPDPIYLGENLYLQDYSHSLYLRDASLRHCVYWDNARQYAESKSKRGYYKFTDPHRNAAYVRSSIRRYEVANWVGTRFHKSWIGPKSYPADECGGVQDGFHVWNYDKALRCMQATAQEWLRFRRAQYVLGLDGLVDSAFDAWIQEQLATNPELAGVTDPLAGEVVG